MPTGYSNKTGANPFKGKKRPAFSIEHRKKISLSSKGRIPWNKGKSNLKKHSAETKLKMSLSHKNEKHWAWVGDKVGYSGIHTWIRKNWGKAKDFKCEFCNKQAYTWANLNHKYSRNKKEWATLCAKCHYHYDRD